MLLYPEDVDRRLTWPLGRATRMAKRQRLPHVLLPDGSIRFEWEEIEPMLRLVAVSKESSELAHVRRKLIEVASQKGRHVSPEILGNDVEVSNG